jgi:hypothetical protein
MKLSRALLIHEHRLGTVTRLVQKAQPMAMDISPPGRSTMHPSTVYYRLRSTSAMCSRASGFRSWKARTHARRWLWYSIQNSQIIGLLCGVTNLYASRCRIDLLATFSRPVIAHSYSYLVLCGLISSE